MAVTQHRRTGDPHAGLTSAEAARRLASGGRNEVGEGGGHHWAGILASQFRTPLVLVLVIAALVSRLLGERVEALVILLIVSLNALLGFIQEYRGERAVRALRRYVKRSARVHRDGRAVEIPAKQPFFWRFDL